MTKVTLHLFTVKTVSWHSVSWLSGDDRRVTGAGIDGNRSKNNRQMCTLSQSSPSGGINWLWVCLPLFDVVLSGGEKLQPGVGTWKGELTKAQNVLHSFFFFFKKRCARSWTVSHVLLFTMQNAGAEGTFKYPTCFTYGIWSKIHESTDSFRGQSTTPNVV